MTENSREEQAPQYNAAETGAHNKVRPLTFCDRHLSQAFPRDQE